MTDIEIAQSTTLLPIEEIAKKAGINTEYLVSYGKYKAKLTPSAKGNKKGKLILVTAINPTPAGEGKTTTSVGLADGLSAIGKNTMVALREPSLGPVFGVKGGAAGGGYAQVVPMEDINLHFTGDIHAITAANNLLAALIDNHIFQGNKLNIDNRKITWKRCLDINDRQLRHVVDGMGGAKSGVVREDSFDITVASEIMAILCLAEDICDLKRRIENIIIGYTFDDKPVTAKDLNAAGSLTTLLKDALMPNLVQTLEHTPALIHGGPFANIAHGCNSVIATKTALSLADYVVTEAGFGADLGAEKFFDIKCRKAGLAPDCVVIVATVRALKHHGGTTKENLNKEDLAALSKGIPNLTRHIENVTKVYGLPAVVCINKFSSDTDKELALVKEECEKFGATAILSSAWGDGSKGALDLARHVVSLCDKKGDFKFSYEDNLSLFDKIRAVAKKVYRANDVIFAPEAKRELERFEALGFGNLPVCIAKTQYSFSDNAALLGAPEGFDITVKQAKISSGAGFIVVLTGNIMTMPGLPKVPAANAIDVDENGNISGLF